MPTPQDRIRRESARRGRLQFVADCIELLRGDGGDPELIVALGGPPAQWATSGEAPGPDYWLRVWAARGLLWEWDESAVAPILEAVDDEDWRVREMALKVIARHRVGEAASRLTDLAGDPVARVRAAAARAEARLARGASGG